MTLPRQVRLLGYIALVVTTARPQDAHADTCLYNGKTHDDRYGELQHFTGEYSCRDSDTKNVTLREHHVDGVQEGEYSRYNARTGQLEEVGTYRHGKRHGVIRRYHNGVQTDELAYVDGEVSGVQKGFREGVLQRVYSIEPDRRGGRVDTDFYFNKQGQLTHLHCGQRPIGMKDEVWCGFNGKQSTVTLYDDKGRKSAVEQYLWGKQHGVEQRFNVVTGAMMHEEHYENGRRAGGSQSFDRQGTMLSKSDCDAARSSCTETQFFEGGKQPREVVVWKAGKTVKRTSYYQNGQEEESVTAEGDKFRILRYYDTGKLRSKGTYLYLYGNEWYWERYMPDGVIEYFDSDGQLSRKEAFQRGVRSGPSLHLWHRRDGKLVREEVVYEKDHLKSQKIFVEDKLTEESEYFPDGSIKSHKDYAPAGDGATKI
jgi:antitoxin component YwqK of YwqJK toxin-antitoxin module